MVEEKTKKAKGSDNDTMLAAASTIPIVGLVVYFGMKDVDPFVRHYARQGIGLLLLLIVNGLLFFVSWVPVLGWLLLCVAFFLSLALFVAWILLLINALQGKKFSLPVLTDVLDSILKE